MSVEMPRSDTACVISTERNQDWPDKMEVVATWGNKRRLFVVTKDEFFGIGAAGAPISGDALISRIDILRRGGGEKPSPHKNKPRVVK